MQEHDFVVDPSRLERPANGRLNERGGVVLKSSGISILIAAQLMLARLCWPFESFGIQESICEICFH